MESKVHQGQSFLDKTIEMTGSFENVFLMSLENNISITETLEIGFDLKFSGKQFKPITDLFDDKNRCATGITKSDFAVIVPDEGIGAMIIEDTFIVR
ncbi:hypothetical protein KHA90_24470 [Flavobacterium psychroterrae]|uniref:Uncharacterized protein n=1 Tax=Flavobacterium psychroterrae TaxID=2133767 RepID=A0ABS5PJ48_9FLAO|nr:hypothetical protein [Flavobacterium psychroterrae]MBS7234161.1 hypothetical protein [Flavobacterium psychroterrae]